jgi:hypothetical protein
MLHMAESLGILPTLLLFACSLMAQVPSHFEIIRQAARQSRSGLRDDVYHYASVVTQPFVPPGALKDLVDGRITDLQLKCMSGALPLVSEDTLVKALNNLGSKIGLPDYGKTNAIEFRIFRMAIPTM